MPDGQPTRQSSDTSAGPAYRPTRPEPATRCLGHRPPPTRPPRAESVPAPAMQNPATWPVPPAVPGLQKRPKPGEAMPTPASPQGGARVPIDPAIAREREPLPRRNPQRSRLRRRDQNQAPAADDPAGTASLTDQKAEFGSVRNACSIGVETRPRIALRWGNLPKRAMISW